MPGFGDYASNGNPQVSSAPIPTGGGFGGYVQQQQPSNQPIAPVAVPTPDKFVPGEDPATNLGQFGQNLEHNLGDMANGIGVAGSAIMARGFDWLVPRKLLDPQTPILDKLKLAPQYLQAPVWPFGNENIGTKGLFQANDPSASQMAGAVVSNVYKNWAQPGVEGFQKGGPLGAVTGEAQGIANYALTRPIDFTLDILPGAGIANKAISPYTAKAFSALDKAAAGSVPFYNMAKGQVESAQAIAKGAMTFNNGFIDDTARNLASVEDLYNQIPKPLRDQVIQAGEMRDLAAYAELSQNSAVQNFWKAAQQVDGKLVGKLIEAGAMTRQEYLVAKYGPYVRATTGLTEQQLWSPRGYQEVLKAKRILDQQGIKPSYFGIMSNKQVAHLLKLKKGLFGAVPTDIKLASEQLAETGAIQTGNRPGFLKARKEGARIPGQHESNAYKVFAARYYEGMQLLRLRDYFLDMLNNPLMQKGGVTFNLHQFFDELNTAAGVNAAANANFLASIPATVQMPKLAYWRLMNLMGNKKGSILQKKIPLLSQVGAIQKTFMLGFNPAWAVNQVIQNHMILGLALFRGWSPKEIAASVMAYTMALNSNFTKKLPASWAANVETESRALITGLRDSDKPLVASFGRLLYDDDKLNLFGQALAIPEKYMNTIFGAASAGDAFPRAVMGAYSLIKQVEQAPQAVQPALKDAFKLMASQTHVLDALNDQTKVENAVKEINAWCGKYDSLTAQEWQMARDIFPFYLWWMHAAALTSAVATKTPVKTAAIGNLTRIAPNVLQPDSMPDSYKDLGAVPLTDNEGKPLLGPNGKPLFMSRPGATPLSQVPELVKQYLYFVKGGAEKEGLPVVNSVIWYLTALSQGVNPSNMSPWNNPHNIRGSGRVWNRAGEEQAKVMPPWPQLAVRSVFPAQEAKAREAIAYPYQPSDFTNPFDAAYKLDSKNKPMKAYPLEASIFYDLTKLKPMEARWSKGDEQRMANMNRRAFRKSRNRQSAKTERDSTSAERIMSSITDLLSGKSN